MRHLLAAALLLLSACCLLTPSAGCPGMRRRIADDCELFGDCGFGGGGGPILSGRERKFLKRLLGGRFKRSAGEVPEEMSEGVEILPLDPSSADPEELPTVEEEQDGVDTGEVDRIERSATSDFGSSNFNSDFNSVGGSGGVSIINAGARGLTTISFNDGSSSGVSISILDDHGVPRDLSFGSSSSSSSSNSNQVVPTVDEDEEFDRIRRNVFNIVNHGHVAEQNIYARRRRSIDQDQEILDEGQEEVLDVNEGQEEVLDFDEDGEVQTVWDEEEILDESGEERTRRNVFNIDNFGTIGTQTINGRKKRSIEIDEDEETPLVDSDEEEEAITDEQDFDEGIADEEDIDEDEDSEDRERRSSIRVFNFQAPNEQTINVPSSGQAEIFEVSSSGASDPWSSSGQDVSEEILDSSTLHRRRRATFNIANHGSIDNQIINGRKKRHAVFAKTGAKIIAPVVAPVVAKTVFKPVKSVFKAFSGIFGRKKRSIFNIDNFGKIGNQVINGRKKRNAL